MLQSRRGEDSLPIGDRRMITVEGKRGAAFQSGDSEAEGERAV